MTLVPLLLALEFGETDPDLAARIKRRDPQAMADLYDRYGRLAYSLILRIVRDREMAEDLVQETFLRVWTRAQAFNSERGALGPWLLAVARNRAIDYLRSTAGRERNALDLEEIDHPALYRDMERVRPLGFGEAHLSCRLSQCSTILSSQNGKTSKPILGAPKV